MLIRVVETFENLMRLQPGFHLAEFVHRTALLLQGADCPSDTLDGEHNVALGPTEEG